MRGRSALLIALTLTCFSLPLRAQGPVRPTTPPAPAPGRADESLMLNIPASSPWTDAGVTLRAGDRFEIRAWGGVRYGDATGTGVGPNGAGRAGGCTFVVADARVPAHALVANIAPQLTFDGAGVLVGASRSATIPVGGTTAPEGRLYLGINHGGMLCDRTGFDSWGFRNSGSGAFTVQLVIRRRH